MSYGGYGGYGGISSYGGYGGISSYGTSMPMTTMPMTGSYVAPSMPTMAAPMPMPMAAPVTIPASNMFSGMTSTPFMPASYYNPSTFGAPTSTFTGMSLPTPMATSVSSLPLGTYGAAGSFGAMTSIPR